MTGNEFANALIVGGFVFLILFVILLIRAAT